MFILFPLCLRLPRRIFSGRGMPNNSAEAFYHYCVLVIFGVIII